MSHKYPPLSRLCGVSLLALLALPALDAAAGGQQPAGAPVVTGPIAAECKEFEGALVARLPQTDTWHAVKPGEKLAPGTAVVGLPKAKLISANGSVQLDMLADVAQRGPFPVMESAVVLHLAPGADLSFTYDRGAIGLTNLKKAGPARVQLRVQQGTWELVLLEPGTKVVLEILGRHPPGGELFGNQPGEEVEVVEVPTMDLFALVLAGKATLSIGTDTFGLKAPPGPAGLFWDNLDGVYKVEQMDSLPEGVRPPTPEESTRLKDIVKCVDCFNSRPIDQTLHDLLVSDNLLDRRVGVICLGALDRLPGLIDALFDAQHPDARDTAIITMRHFMGRGPGQAKKLYQAFLQDPRFGAINARTALQLLDGFSDEDRQNPVTFELLLAYLLHNDLAIRELAWWHLHRLAGVANKVQYDAGAPAAARQQAVAELQRLIPRGTVPEPPRPEDLKKIPGSR